MRKRPQIRFSVALRAFVLVEHRGFHDFLRKSCHARNLRFLALAPENAVAFSGGASPLGFESPIGSLNAKIAKTKGFRDFVTWSIGDSNP